MRTEDTSLDDPESPHYRHRVAADASVSEAVVAAVADATGRRPVSVGSDATDEDGPPLPPLYDAVDTDALDALVDDGRASDVTVTFRYADRRVAVHGDGVVSVAAFIEWYRANREWYEPLVLNS